MNFEVVELEGHIIDSNILSKVLDKIISMGGDFEIEKLEVGKTNEDKSYARILVKGKDGEHLDNILREIQQLGAVVSTDDVETKKAPRDKVLPDDFYGTTNLPTYVKIDGVWKEVEDIEMDCVIVIENRNGEKVPVCKRMGLIKEGDEVVVGYKGIRVVPLERSREKDIFGFMQSEVSPEKPLDYYSKMIAEEIKRIKKNNGKIVWVVGTAIAHTRAHKILEKFVRDGYVDALFCGNGFATMDIEYALFGTTLGMDDTCNIVKGGYKSHLVAINEMWKAGGIKEAVKKGILKKGVLYECVKNNVPYVIGGSLRDDGPLPDTITDVMVAQDEMRKHAKNADMCIILATMLHGIATGNILPARVKTVCIDMNPYVVTRLQDRGTHQAVGIVSDPCAFLHLLEKDLYGKE
ncbi:LOR/SDH bifunctional protein conserved domain protein [Methanocaldococcus sp. FS406-22]|uniref:ornithine cyclodeaminase n=1 Tax=Methanocaldococcus sp. (strain FS406-22) TaxID=644281 RepID=UPI0001BF0998|nr:TIGR00300 family protein [Methanocaldococcus sp. FS406-22]ADC69117.1 LOR/SDH bifunctional protein conserved domain protein [Methanocaldococcus sp. FS406-22]